MTGKDDSDKTIKLKRQQARDEYKRKSKGILLEYADKKLAALKIEFIPMSSVSNNTLIAFLKDGIVGDIQYSKAALIYGDAGYNRDAAIVVRMDAEHGYILRVSWFRPYQIVMRQYFIPDLLPLIIPGNKVQALDGMIHPVVSFFPVTNESIRNLVIPGIDYIKNQVERRKLVCDASLKLFIIWLEKMYI